MVLDTGDYWDPRTSSSASSRTSSWVVDEFWVVIPEGNAKTTLMSGVGAVSRRLHADG
jgi:hypothetical protein